MVVRAGDGLAGQCEPGRGSAVDRLLPGDLPQSTLDFTPERDRYGQVDIDALVVALPTLRVAQQVAAGQHFHHWELEFADQFKSRGGFDLVLGNPPWIKVEWNEQALLSDFDPRFAIRRLSAKETADQREAVFTSRRRRGLTTLASAWPPRGWPAS
jgi:hypothetical protein